MSQVNMVYQEGQIQLYNLSMSQLENSLMKQLCQIWKKSTARDNQSHTQTIQVLLYKSQLKEQIIHRLITHLTISMPMMNSIEEIQ